MTSACPFCVVMLADGVTLRQEDPGAAGAVDVTDVAEVLLRSVRTSTVDANDPEGATR